MTGILTYKLLLTLVTTRGFKSMAQPNINLLSTYLDKPLCRTQKSALYGNLECVIIQLVKYARILIIGILFGGRVTAVDAVAYSLTL